MARRRSSARQIAASRRNLVIARRRKIRRGVAAGIGTAAVIGTAITARHVYNKNFISQRSLLTDQRNRGAGFINKTRKGVEVGIKHRYRPDLEFEHRMLHLGIVRSTAKNQHMYHTLRISHDPLYAGSRKRHWHGGIKYGR